MKSAGAFTASTASTRWSASRWNTAKPGASASPRTTASCTSKARPAICSRRSNWSDQNHGTSGGGGGRPQISAAACLACSMRVRHAFQPARAAIQRQRPLRAVADGVDGRVAAARRQVHHDAAGAVEPGRLRPARSFGTAPMPTSTASQGMRVPSRQPHARTPRRPRPRSPRPAHRSGSRRRAPGAALRGRPRACGRRRAPARAPRARSPPLRRPARGRRPRPPARYSRRRSPPAACPGPSAACSASASAVPRSAMTPASSAPGKRQRARPRAQRQDQPVIAQHRARPRA